MSDEKNVTSDIEWFIIPEFPDYEITAFGIIRNRYTRILMPVRLDPFCDGQVTIWDNELKSQTRAITSLISSAIRNHEKSEDGIDDYSKNSLTEALSDELTKVHPADNYGVNDKIAQAMVDRLIKEGWHPNGQCG